MTTYSATKSASKKKTASVGELPEPTRCFPAEIVSLETNSLRQPFFYHSKKRINTIDKLETKGRRTIRPKDLPAGIQQVQANTTIAISTALSSGTPSVVIDQQGTTVEFLYRVSRNTDLPYPGPLSRKLHVAILRTMQATQKWPYQNPIAFPWRQLARNAEIGWHGKRKEAWIEAIRSTKAALIHSENALIDGSTGKPFARRSHDFHLYSRVVFYEDMLVGESGEQVVADKNYVWLDDWVLANINYNYAGKLNYPYWHFLNTRPLASRLYEYLTFIAQANYNTLTINYRTLCTYLPAEPQLRHNGRCDGHQVHEIGCGKKKCVCKPCNCPVNVGRAFQQLTPSLELLKTQVAIEGQTCQAVSNYRWQRAANGDMQLFIVLGNCFDMIAQQSRHLHEDEVATQTEQYSDKLPSERVAIEFGRLWKGDEDYEPLDAELVQASKRIDKHGLEFVMNVLPSLIVVLKENWPGCDNFCGAVRHWPAAVALHQKKQRKAEKKLAKQKKEEGRQPDQLPYKLLRKTFSKLTKELQEHVQQEAMATPSSDFELRKTKECRDMSKPSRDMLRRLHKQLSDGSIQVGA